MPHVKPERFSRVTVRVAAAPRRHPVKTPPTSRFARAPMGSPCGVGRRRRRRHSQAPRRRCHPPANGIVPAKERKERNVVKPIILDCGGERSATPLLKSGVTSESGVAAVLCHRCPKPLRPLREDNEIEMNAATDKRTLWLPALRERSVWVRAVKFGFTTGGRTSAQV